MTLSVRLATELELEAVWRLRYRCLIEEQGLACSDEQRRRGMLDDDADQLAAQFVAVGSDGVLRGTLRVNILSDGVPRPLDTMLAALGGRAPAPERTAVTSRLAIRSEDRASRVLGMLARVPYLHMVQRGVEFNLVFVQPHHTLLFRRMGFASMDGGTVRHPQAESVPMLLRCLDHAHLREIGSILRPRNGCER